MNSILIFLGGGGNVAARFKSVFISRINLEEIMPLNKQGWRYVPTCLFRMYVKANVDYVI